MITKGDSKVTTTTKNAALLWTGGKDCALAMHRALEQGIDVSRIVTFVPPDAHFLAHPLDVMQAQIDAIGKPWHRPQVVEPHFESYREALSNLRSEYGVDTVITGDISLVDGHPNWIRQCAEGLDIEVLTPLWELDRVGLLHELLDHAFEVIISAVRLAAMDESWLGRTIDAGAIRQLQGLNGVDPCGENGEFHSVVLDAPFFRSRIDLAVDSISRTSEMAFAQLRVR